MISEKKKSGVTHDIYIYIHIYTSILPCSFSSLYLSLSSLPLCPPLPFLTPTLPLVQILTRSTRIRSCTKCGTSLSSSSSCLAAAMSNALGKGWMVRRANVPPEACLVSWEGLTTTMESTTWEAGIERGHRGEREGTGGGAYK